MLRVYLLNRINVRRGIKPGRCAVSVPCAVIPCALKRFFSIPDQSASVRAYFGGK